MTCVECLKWINLGGKSNPRLHGVTNSTVSVIHAHKMDPSQDHEGEYFSKWDKGSQVEYVNPE